MEDIIIYHNGECSKCKGALELLQQLQIPHEVRFYLAEPISREELEMLLEKLQLPARELVRTSEPLFIDRYGNREIGDNEWLDILLEFPQLMQRPVVVKGDRAIIARPPEKVLEFIK